MFFWLTKETVYAPLASEASVCVWFQTSNVPEHVKGILTLKSCSHALPYLSFSLTHTRVNTFGKRSLVAASVS